MPRGPVVFFEAVVLHNFALNFLTFKIFSFVITHNCYPFMQDYVDGSQLKIEVHYASCERHHPAAVWILSAVKS